MSAPDWSKYLTSERMSEIAEEEFRDALQQKLKTDGDVQRIVSNIAYQIVADAVDARIEGGLTLALTEQVEKIVGELTGYSVFRKADAWGNKESVGQKLLDEATFASRAVIEAKVAELTGELSIGDISRYVAEVIQAALADGLEATS